MSASDHAPSPDLLTVLASLREEVAKLRAELVARAGQDRTAVDAGDYQAPRWATATELCKELNVKRPWAYAHRAQLGAVAFGDGLTKPRLRFDMEAARAYWASLSLAKPPERPAEPRRRRPSAGGPQDSHTRAGNALVDVPAWSVSS